jgi:hypothetical protein
MPPRASIAAVSALLLAACSRGGGREARDRLEARDRAARPAPFDWSRPISALEMTAGEAARRLGSLDFAASVSWSVTRGAASPGPVAPEAAPPAAPGASIGGATGAAPGGAAPASPGAPAPAPAEPLRVRAVERHHLRQLAGGDFHVLAEIDPGTWGGAETGKEVFFVGGTTWARGRYAPFRERPTDRGRDARRFRDESFRLAADLAALFGPQLSATPRGEASALGRPARRYALSLSREPGRAEGQADEGAGRGAAADDDTRRRLDFFEGRAPLSLEGEMLLDAESGVPLAVRMKGTFGQKGDPRLRAEVALDARITGWGSMVEAVAPPQGALADDRKPRGVARALEEAGLRKRGEEKAEERQDEGPEGE